MSKPYHLLTRDEQLALRIKQNVAMGGDAPLPVPSYKDRARRSLTRIYDATVASRKTVPASSKQVEYLEILLGDSGYSTRVQRMAFVTERTGRMVAYLDELTMSECTELIAELKAVKQDRRVQEQVWEEEQEF